MFLLDIQLFLPIDFPKGLLKSSMSWGTELWVSGMTIATIEIDLQTHENPIICKTGSPYFWNLDGVLFVLIVTSNAGHLEI